MNNSMVSLLESSEDSDVVVKIGMRSFHLHALILKTRSPYFKGALTSGQNMKESNGTLELDGGVRENTFEAVLPFIYGSHIGPLDALSHEDVINLFELSNYLQLTDFESYIGRQTPEHDGSGSPFKRLKECIKKNVEQVEESDRRIWLLTECYKAAQAPVPAAPLKEALLEILCEHCRNAQHYEAAYVCLTLFHTDGEPSAGDLSKRNAYPSSALVKEDVHWIKTITETVCKLRTAPPQTEPALVQSSLKSQIEALKVELHETEALKVEMATLKSMLRSKGQELQSCVQDS